MKCKILFFFLALMAVNCAKTTYYLKDPEIKVRFSPYTEDEGYKMKKRFEKTVTRINLFWGLTRYDEKDLDSLIAEEIGRDKENTALGNLTIKEHYTFLDSLIDLIVIGLIRPYSVTVSGIIYKSEKEDESDEPVRRTKKKADSSDEEDEPKVKSKKKKAKDSDDADAENADNEGGSKPKSSSNVKKSKSSVKKTELDSEEESSKKEENRKKGK